MEQMNDRVPPPFRSTTRNDENHDERPPIRPLRCDAHVAGSLTLVRPAAQTNKLPLVPRTNLMVPAMETLVVSIKDPLVVEAASRGPPRRRDDKNPPFRRKVQRQGQTVGADEDNDLRVLTNHDDVVISASMIPGAVASGGAVLRPGDDNSAPQNLVSAGPPSSVDLEQHQIVAKLVPDDYAEVEARIMPEVNERLTRETKEGHSNEMIVVEAEEVKDSFSCCGLQLRTLWMLVILGMLVIGGVVVVAGVYSLRRGNNDAATSPPSAPTTFVDPSLLQELISWNALSEEDLSLFSDPSSSAPQYHAVNWLTRNDTLAMSPGRSMQDVLQRYVLAVLYFATSGLHWTWSYLSSNEDVCTWNNGTEHRYGVYCNLDGVSIDELIFDTNDLRGPLPWELVLLTNLEIISLSGNTLTGSIPTRISELTRLRTFDVSENDLSGPLPTTFSSETTRISLHNNRFVGSIPRGWGTGSMPVLEVLSLYGNGLTGPLPSSFVQRSTLRDLNLVWNHFTGVLPSDLGQMTALTRLNLLNNQLSGTIPSELGHMLSLEYLSLADNALTGTIPTELSQLPSLTLFNVDGNQLNGTIPPELGHMLSLDYLHVARNVLTGTIPSELGRLTDVQNLSVQQNQLTGSIPSELGRIGALERADFAGNLLTGSVDEVFCTAGKHSTTSSSTWVLLSVDCSAVDCECCTTCH